MIVIIRYLYLSVFFIYVWLLAITEWIISIKVAFSKTCSTYQDFPLFIQMGNEKITFWLGKLGNNIQYLLNILGLTNL